MHTRIRSWHASRSGPTITIKGDVEGDRRSGKVSGVVDIMSAHGVVIATTRDGQTFELLV